MAFPIDNVRCIRRGFLCLCSIHVYYFMVLVFCLFSFIGCDGTQIPNTDDSDSNLSSLNILISPNQTPIPVEITITVQIANQSSCVVTEPDGRAALTVSDVPIGMQEYMITWMSDEDAPCEGGPLTLTLAQLGGTVEVQTGSNSPLTPSSDQIETAMFNDDGDNCTNLEEVQDSTDPRRASDGQPVFFYNPMMPYQSRDDIPRGFYAGGGPAALEDFEDDMLDFDVEASAGIIVNPGGVTDSVDADDGELDGRGINGHSWFQSMGRDGVMFTFPSMVTAAGIVWTDANTNLNEEPPFVFEVFGPDMVSLGSIRAEDLGDGEIDGGTEEDRFFGVQDVNGIIAIQVRTIDGPGVFSSAFEVDHLQFGNSPPCP